MVILNKSELDKSPTQLFEDAASYLKWRPLVIDL